MIVWQDINIENVVRPDHTISGGSLIDIDQNQLNNAKLYSNRIEFLNDLPKHISVLEIGTLAGDFANVILDKVIPAKLDLVDYFYSSDFIHLNRFDKENHYEFVKNRFKKNKVVTLYKGLSNDILPNLKGKYDFIYIDAEHDFYSVKNDFLKSAHLFNEDTIIGFNDYTVEDLHGVKYGIMSFVNMFLYQNKDWEVIGFSLHDRMFCDIYIRKRKER